jgi:hypothetical protein
LVAREKMKRAAISHRGILRLLSLASHPNGGSRALLSFATHHGGG